MRYKDMQTEERDQRLFFFKKILFSASYLCDKQMDALRTPENVFFFFLICFIVIYSCLFRCLFPLILVSIRVNVSPPKKATKSWAPKLIDLAVQSQRKTKQEHRVCDELQQQVGFDGVGWLSGERGKLHRSLL